MGNINYTKRIIFTEKENEEFIFAENADDQNEPLTRVPKRKIPGSIDYNSIYLINFIGTTITITQEKL